MHIYPVFGKIQIYVVEVTSSMRWSFLNSQQLAFRKDPKTPEIFRLALSTSSLSSLSPGRVSQK